MKPSQPQLPFSTEPIDWTQGVECKFGQLADVTAAAERAGFCAARMHVITGGYCVEFQRDETAVVTTPPGNQNAASVTAAHKAGVNRLDAIK
jgi:hypothetical protein